MSDSHHTDAAVDPEAGRLPSPNPISYTYNVFSIIDNVLNSNSTTSFNYLHLHIKNLRPDKLHNSLVSPGDCSRAEFPGRPDSVALLCIRPHILESEQIAGLPSQSF